MAAVTGSSDFVVLNDASDLAAWGALGGGGAGLAVETDFWVEGGSSISKQVKTETKGMWQNNTTYAEMHLGPPRYFWLYTTTPKAMDLSPNGGMRITGGTNANNRKEWYVSGSELQDVGGWYCYVVEGNTQGDNTIGSPSAYTDSGGILSNTGAVRGINFGIDVISQGNYLRVSGGDGADADANLDSFLDITNSFGPFIERKGNYELLTRLEVGVDDATTATEFTQSGGQVIIPRRQLATSRPMISEELSSIQIQGSQTTATFSGTSFLGLDYLNRGRITTAEPTNSPTATFDGCSFEGIGRIDLATGSTLTGCTVKNVNQVDLTAGGTIDNCKMQGSGVTGPLTNITNCSFSPSRRVPENWLTLKVNGSSIDYTSDVPISIDAPGTFGSDADGDFYQTGTGGANPIRVHFHFDPYGFGASNNMHLHLRLKCRLAGVISVNDYLVRRQPGYTGNDSFCTIRYSSASPELLNAGVTARMTGALGETIDLNGAGINTTHTYVWDRHHNLDTGADLNASYIDGVEAYWGSFFSDIPRTPSNTDWVMEIGAENDLCIYEFAFVQDFITTDAFSISRSTASDPFGASTAAPSYNIVKPSLNAITTDVAGTFTSPNGTYDPSNFPTLALDAVVIANAVGATSQTGVNTTLTPFNYTGQTYYPALPVFTGTEPYAFRGMYEFDNHSSIFTFPQETDETVLVCWRGYLESGTSAFIPIWSINDDDVDHNTGTDPISMSIEVSSGAIANYSFSYLGSTATGNINLSAGADLQIFVKFQRLQSGAMQREIFFNNFPDRNQQSYANQSSSTYKFRFGSLADATDAFVHCRSFQIFSGATENDVPDPQTYQMPDGPPIGPAESLIGNTFTGYGADGEDDAAIYFTANSGIINVNVSSGSVPTYKSNGATVNFILSSSLTLTGLVDGSEVRVYAAGTTNEVAGEESVSGGTFNTTTSEASVDIVVFALGYLYLRLSAVDTSTDRTIPIQQRIDRQYENP